MTYGGGSAVLPPHFSSKMQALYQGIYAKFKRNQRKKYFIKDNWRYKKERSYRMPVTGYDEWFCVQDCRSIERS